jgi:hypothetical protein
VEPALARLVYGGSSLGRLTHLHKSHFRRTSWQRLALPRARKWTYAGLLVARPSHRTICFQQLHLINESRQASPLTHPRSKSDAGLNWSVLTAKNWPMRIIQEALWDFSFYSEVATGLTCPLEGVTSRF